MFYIWRARERGRAKLRERERDIDIYIYIHTSRLYIIYIHISLYNIIIYIYIVSYIYIWVWVRIVQMFPICFLNPILGASQQRGQIHTKSSTGPPMATPALSGCFEVEFTWQQWNREFLWQKFSKPKPNKPWRIDDQSTIWTIWCVWIVPRGLGDTEVASVHSSMGIPHSLQEQVLDFTKDIIWHIYIYITYICIYIYTYINTIKLTNLDRTVWTHAHSPHTWK